MTPAGTGQLPYRCVTRTPWGHRQEINEWCYQNLGDQSDWLIDLGFEATTQGMSINLSLHAVIHTRTEEQHTLATLRWS